MTPSKDRNYFKQEPRGEITAHSEAATGTPSPRPRPSKLPP